MVEEAQTPRVCAYMVMGSERAAAFVIECIVNFNLQGRSTHTRSVALAIDQGQAAEVPEIF
jgi:hypothetical protein